MTRIILFASFLFCNVAMVFAADVRNSKDHPSVGRFEGSEIIIYSHSNFDEYRLIVKPLTSNGSLETKNAQNTKLLEGELYRITYKAPEEASSLAVFRAYQDALFANGFESLFECNGESACGNGNGYNFNRRSPGRTLSQRFINTKGDSTRYQALKKSSPQGDVYVSLHVAEERGVYAQVDVIEVKAQKSKVVLIKANEMSEKIDQDGKVALYGLYFNTNKATIKNDSKPTLDEIGKLLKKNSDLKLLVVGHTDNQGGFDYNIKLSQQRAASVKNVLVNDYGIKASRLKSWGVGYTAPVASNKSEQGRSENRRVELVAQ